jgi:cytochrome c peroxidase
MRKPYRVLLLSALPLLAACPGSSSSSVTSGGTKQSALDRQLRALIAERGLTGNPLAGRDLPSIDEPLAQLGKRLFFTQSLGGQFDSSCASCHHPNLAGGDALVLPTGVDAEDPALLGPGRRQEFGTPGWDGGPTVPRNSPTTFNSGLYDRSMFWDSRVESLGRTPGANGGDGLGIDTPDSQGFGIADPNAGDNLVMAQALFPVTSRDEMKGYYFEFGSWNDTIRNHLAARLGDYGIGRGEIVDQWLPYFRAAFDSIGTAEELVTYENIARALSEYERSQVFVDNAWFDYVRGDDFAISEAAKRGALAFYRDKDAGGAGCYECHAGDFFTDEEHYALAMPQVGRGKGDGHLNGPEDFGRLYETGAPEDRYAFRTPTLLNVETTGPWNHCGSYTSLEAVIYHHCQVQDAVANYDFNQLPPDIQTTHTIQVTNDALAQVLANRATGVKTIEDVPVTPEGIADLVEFLKSLTDPCILDPQCMEPWVQRDHGFDEHLLEAHDENGDPL